MTFNWFDRGRHILLESGKYGYQKGKQRDFFLGTSAHNTVAIDEKDDSRSAKDAFGSGIQDILRSGDEVSMKAVIERRPSRVWHERTLTLRPGHSLEVRDRLRADGAHRYIQWFHLAPALELGTVDGRIAVNSDGRPFMLVTAPHGTRIVVFRGSEDPLQGWISESYLQMTPRWSIGFVREATSVDLVTRFDLL